MPLPFSYSENRNTMSYHFVMLLLCMAALYLCLHFYFLCLLGLNDFLLSHLLTPFTIITNFCRYHCSRRVLCRHIWVGIISPHIPRFSTITVSTIKRWSVTHQMCDSLAILNQIMRWSSIVITYRGWHGILHWRGCKSLPLLPFGVRIFKFTLVFVPFSQCLSVTVSPHPLQFLSKVF